MKTLYQILLTLAICAALQFVLPWWSVAIGAALVAFFFEQPGWRAFTGGFVAVFFLWAATAWWLNASGGALLAIRLNHLLPVNAILLTGLVGGLVGGLAALTGKLVRAA